MSDTLLLGSKRERFLMRSAIQISPARNRRVLSPIPRQGASIMSWRIRLCGSRATAWRSVLGKTDPAISTWAPIQLFSMPNFISDTARVFTPNQ